MCREAAFLYVPTTGRYTVTFAPSQHDARDNPGDNPEENPGDGGVLELRAGPIHVRLTPGIWLRLVLVVIAAVALLLGAVSRVTAGTQHVDALVGRAAPAFTLPGEVHGQLQSGATSLAASHGSTRLLVFFYTLCSHCLPELATVEQAQQTLAHESGPGFVPVYIDSPAENPATADAYVTRVGITAPVLLDAGSQVAAHYGIAYSPALVLVDGGGIVRDTWTGEPDATTLVTAIRQRGA